MAEHQRKDSLMKVLQRLDQGLARVEERVTIGVLLSMVMVAGFSAFVRNLTRFDVQWANDLLMDLDWADSFLRKGTLWIAFLGCSLATYHRKHIAIDLALRLVAPRIKYLMLAFAMTASGVITLALSYSFSAAVHLNITERPIEYEVLGDDGSMHVCDASDATLAALEDFERPSTFCAVRSALAVVGIPAETPGGAFQLIVPLMMIITGIRLICYGVGSGLIVAAGPEAIERAEAEENARNAAVHEATGTSLTPPPNDSGKAGGLS
jgi:TRAP-type C4-dicarboxylate transport system permease small subunit